MKRNNNFFITPMFFEIIYQVFYSFAVLRLGPKFHEGYNL